MALDRSTQPIVKDASGVLVGVAQVRVGRPSIRGAGVAANAPKFIAVGKSQKAFSISYAAVCLVKPNEVWTLNDAATPTAVIIGSYTGKLDGNLIIRAVATVTAGTSFAEASSSAAADKIEIFDTYGRLAYTSTALVLGTPVCLVQGLTITGTFTGAKVGDTWVVPCWTGAAINLNQTGIITPFSMFYDAADSVGGLSSSSFTPKLESIKKLETGFPSSVADQLVEKVSVSVSWESMEYTNSKLSLLKQMVSRVINTGELSSISVEMVARTRGNSLVRFWIPSCVFSQIPSISPKNDYSSVPFAMEALKQTEFTAITASMGLDALTAPDLAIYNGWLADSWIYNEQTY